MENGGQMENGEKSCTKLCQFRVEVPENCMPINNKIKVRRDIDEGVLRAQGQMNIDLWTKGQLYPVDPILQKHPEFNSASGLIKFTCKGNLGLLGYCRNLASGYSEPKLKAAFHHEQASNYNLKCQLDALAKHNIFLAQSCNSFLQEIAELKTQSSQLEQRLVAESIRSKRLLEDRHQLEKRVKRLKSTPLGARERIRSIKSIDTLKPSGGGFKKRIHAIKTLMDPSLHYKYKGKRNGHLLELLKRVVSKNDVLKLINLPGTNLLRQAIIENVLQQLNEEQSADGIQYVCDSAGISKKAYTLLFKALKSSSNLGVMKAILPRVSKVWSYRTYRNKKIRELLGNMIHINSSINLDTLEWNKGKRKKSAPKQSSNFVLDMNNNCWIDLENLLKLMVKYYDMKVEDCDGKLIVVIKLDEMEMIKGKKYERVSVTLMNRAICQASCEQENFSVQSEEHIWWVGIFQVPKESHAILKWVFDQTSIPILIASHTIGEKLVVPNYGAYEVEWHMAADLKTIKCMFDMKHGAAKTTAACIYCLYTFKSKDCRNTKSTLDCDQALPPCREQQDNSLDPVLPIELKRIHVCTLHAFLRIIDKMVYLRILFAWNKTPTSSKNASIAAIEMLLSDMGLHGGNYRIVEDTKRSGNVPSKPSMGGVKARRFLPSSVSGAKGKWECYKDLLKAEDDRTDHGRSYAKKMKAWQLLFPLVELMNKKQYTEEDKEAFRPAVSNFTKAFIAAWGEGELTHYMHILYAHGPWFAEEYGSLGIWNTQGMEKSHKQAKNAYFRFTQHGGARFSSSPLQQMSDWFYRRIIAKLEKKEKSSKETTLALAIRKKLKADAWHRSTGNNTLKQWRSQRQRQGKKYVPKE